MVLTEHLHALAAGSDDLARVVRAILQQTDTRGSADAWQVAGTANVPFADLIDILQSLRARNLVEFEGSQMRLTAEGGAFAHALHVAHTPPVTCPLCAGSGVHTDPFADARAQYVPLLSRRPKAQATYDQGALTAESIFRRLALMVHHGDIADKRVLLLGDDDLLSIALALTGLPREIVVVEIDPRLCQFIETVAREQALPIRVIQHDARDQFPADLRAHFDTFITDPSETIQGLLLFVEKGLAMLKPGGGHVGYFGLTLIEASMLKWNLWQRHLLQNHALVLTHITEPFSLYAESGGHGGGASHLAVEPLTVPPRVPWYRSSLFRVETLREFVPPADYNSNPRDELYQDAESLEEAWLVLARGGAQSPIPIPDEFLNASAQRAESAHIGIGRHVIAEFWNCENAASEQGLSEAIAHAVRNARATLLDLQIRRFYPQGYSAIALLAESHISLHAWPELGYVAIDVFTCGPAEPLKIVQGLESHFRPHDTEYIKIPRGRLRIASDDADLALTPAIAPIS